MVTLIIDSSCDFAKTSDVTPRDGLNFEYKTYSRIYHLHLPKQMWPKGRVIIYIAVAPSKALLAYAILQFCINNVYNEEEGEEGEPVQT